MSVGLCHIVELWDDAFGDHREGTGEVVSVEAFAYLKKLLTCGRHTVIKHHLVEEILMGFCEKTNATNDRPVMSVCFDVRTCGVHVYSTRATRSPGSRNQQHDGVDAGPGSMG